LSRRSDIRLSSDSLIDDSLADDEGVRDAQMIAEALALYGGDAPTAIAYCALEAWSEGDQDEYRFWSRLFRRLRN
jgi:hypothetical protein